MKPNLLTNHAMVEYFHGKRDTPTDIANSYRDRCIPKNMLSDMFAFELRETAKERYDGIQERTNVAYRAL